MSYILLKVVIVYVSAVDNCQLGNIVHLYIIDTLLHAVESNSWANGDEDHFVARAEYDFRASNNNEISFTAGQMINIAPKGLCAFFCFTCFLCL